MQDTAQLRFPRTVSLIALVVFGFQVGTQAHPSQQQRQDNLLSFDQVWTTVRNNHWDASLGGLDWDAVRIEYRERVEKAQTTAESRAVIREMLGRLNHSHFEIHAADHNDEPDPALRVEAQEGTCGIEVRVVQGQALVWRVAAGSSADQAGVRRGWCIHRINGSEITTQLRDTKERLGTSPVLGYQLAWVAMRLLSGPVGNTVSIVFLDGNNQLTPRSLPFGRRSGHAYKLANMPIRYVWFQSRLLKSEIGYVTFNTWIDPPYLVGKIRESVAAFKNTNGLIIDLRGSRGGIIQLAQDLAGYFIKEPGHTLGTLKFRNRSYDCTVVPKDDVYDGPVAIIVDGLSRSTSEILASGMRQEGRARLFGTRTAGTVSASLVSRLANGDSFQYAVADFRTIRGEPLEGAGVKPDVEVPLTREDLLANRDSALEAAADWIMQVTPERTRPENGTGRKQQKGRALQGKW